MKYIVIENSFGLEIPMIFPEITTHEDMIPFDAKVVSAGFCEIIISCDFVGFIGMGEIDVNCWGKSLSLNKESRGEIDSKLILTSIKKY